MPRSQSSPDAESSEVPLELLGQFPDVFAAYLIQNISIVVWSGAATLDSLSLFERLSASCQRRFPSRMSCVQVLAARHIPDTTARDELARINRTYSDMIASCALVIPGKGFMASALRGLVTAVLLRSDAQDLPIKIVPSLVAAAQWLPEPHLQGTGVAISPALLASALRQVYLEP